MCAGSSLHAQLAANLRLPGREYSPQATGLRLVRNNRGGGSTGALLRQLEAQHQKSCDEDLAGRARDSSGLFTLASSRSVGHEML